MSLSIWKNFLNCKELGRYKLYFKHPYLDITYKVYNFEIWIHIFNNFLVNLENFTSISQSSVRTLPLMPYQMER